MFCIYCWKVTETKNERMEDLKEYTILKGECKECNKIKTGKKNYKQNTDNITLLI